jgi:predicted DNA-binding transcriptional regulator AlpA
MGQQSTAPIASGPIYIDEREVARRTTLSPRTLQLMRRKGGGPAWAKLGGRVVYKWADVEGWIADRTRTGAAS